MARDAWAVETFPRTTSTRGGLDGCVLGFVFCIKLQRWVKGDLKAILFLPDPKARRPESSSMNSLWYVEGDSLTGLLK